MIVSAFLKTRSSVPAPLRAADAGAKVLYTNDPLEAARGAQVLNTDVWASMGQEDEKEERAAIFHDYQVDEAMMARAAPGAYFLHCLPAHRDEEITDEVMESRHAIIYDEAENRLHVQKAIMATLMG